MKLKLKCRNTTSGFTKDKKYKVLGAAGEYVALKDDKGQVVHINEIYFEPVERKGY